MSNPTPSKRQKPNDECLLQQKKWIERQIKEAPLQTFKIKQHSKYVLANLNKMREEQSFCDVCLEMQKKKISAHRVVLSAASDYFNTMFTVDMKEKYQQTVRIEEISYETMQAVINFIYSGAITVTKSSISSILNAASLMQIPDLLDAVGEYLSDALNIDNCLLFRKLALLHSLDLLLDVANWFVSDNFEEISSQEMFFDLDAEEMEFLLKSDELNVEEEKTVFEVLLKWINKDLQNRKQHFPSLFKNIRLQYIPVKYVAGTIRKDKLVREFLDCRDLVEDAFFFHISPEMVVAETPRLSYEPKPDSFMVVSHAYNNENKFHIKNKIWTQTATIGWRRNLVLTECAVAAKPSCYMFCGGKVHGSQTASNAVVLFNGKEWKTVAAMKVNRCGGTAVFHRNNLYVFGGERLWTNPTLRYNNPSNQIPEKNFAPFNEVFNGDWKAQGKIRSVRSYARAECLKSKIYLFGGFTLNSKREIQHNYQNEYCKIPCFSTDVYDIQSNKWCDGPQLNVARADFASSVLHSTIYVFGGTGVNNSNLLDIELMDTSSKINVWTKIYLNSPYSLRQPSSCCINEQFYVKSADNNTVVCFNPIVQKWSQADPNGCSVNGNLIIPIYS